MNSVNYHWLWNDCDSMIVINLVILGSRETRDNFGPRRIGRS